MGARMDRAGVAGVEIGRLIIGQTITTFVRCICAALALSNLLMAWGPLFHADSVAYQNPVFRSVFRFASPTAWGIGFAVSGLVLLAAAVSARAIVYLIGVTVASLSLVGWAWLVIYEAATTDATLTSGAIGLYVGTFTALLGLAASPRQLDVPRPLELVLASADDEPIPLRRTGT